MVRQLEEQRSENDKLRNQILAANSQIRSASASITQRLEDNTAAERAKAAQERADMLVQITAIVNANAEAQQKRLEHNLVAMGDDLEKARNAHEKEEISYAEGMNELQAKAERTVDDVMRKSELTDAALQSDYVVCRPNLKLMCMD